MKKTLSCVDLFCGAGGLSLGLKNAGFRTALALDKDAVAVRTYRENFPEAKVVTEDVRTVNWRVFRGSIDLVAGGPPCQPFSVAGDQLASADVRDMVPEFVRAVRDISPRIFLMENVPGLAGKRHGGYFQAQLDKLRDLGYYVNYRILNAADFGVPQGRQRVFVLGSKDFLPTFPRPTHGPEGKLPYVPARDKLTDTPPDELNTAIVTYARQPILRASPFAGMLVNGGGRPIDLDRPANTVPASAGGNRTQIVDLPGVLLDYHSHLQDGGRPRVGRVKHVRRLTIRESARLQDFPDSFKFTGQKSAQYRQIGNAVPPKLSEAVARHLIKQL